MSSGALEQRVLRAVTADPVCAAILDRMPSLGLPDWWLTAGAIFQSVWNQITGRAPGHGIKDYDVFYFDAEDLSWEAEDAVIRAAADLFADVPATVEIRNEARVHLWYEQRFGVPMEPFTSSADAIHAFAATACSVGVTATDGTFTITAPHGLDDLVALRLRPHTRLAPRAVHEAKARQYQERWPELTVEHWPIEQMQSPR